ncbi:hypothetical protein BGZ79_010588 [Entomortierella chlamydospora]|nr:hypothetical protein BGZ79_010588 [Entomortierella chlamydospora]
MDLTSLQSATSIALKIPEILELIASFIGENKHLASCVLVCKAWHENFSSFLFYSLRIHPNSTIGSISAGIRNATHVQYLDLWTDIAEGQYPLPFNKLRTLHITHRYPKDPNFVISQVADLIMRNGDTLQDVMLCRLYEPSTNAMWEAISSCKRINKVRFHHCTVDEQIWNAISKVRRLIFTHSYIVFSSVKAPLTAASPPKLLNLQYLEMFRTVGTQGGGFIGIIQHAPNLSTLRFDPDLNAQTVPYAHQFATALKGCRNLKHLILDNTVLSGEGNTMILDSLTDSKTLHWSVDGFPEQAIRSLMSRHSKTITDLYLTGTTGLTSRMAQTIMTGCPMLESLTLNMISGTDLVRIVEADQENQDGFEDTDQVIVGEDWVCLGLKELKIEFDLSSKEMNIDRDTPEGEAMFQRQQQLEQYHAFRQIGRLIHLWRLDISGNGFRAGNERTLDLRLRSNGGGLEGMMALRDLRRFHFENTKQELSEGEIDWMISRFPRLGSLMGTYHSDEPKNTDLHTYFWKQAQEGR